MIQQLIKRLMDPPVGMTKENAAALVLSADPFDLILHMEQVWDRFNAQIPQALPNQPPDSPIRTSLMTFGLVGQFGGVIPPQGPPAWDHFGYAFVLENTRVAQIMARVVREYRSGEGLGVPSVSTQRWLDATEALLFGGAFPISTWLSTSAIRPSSEAVRRNAYWRILGMDLAFGGDDNRPFSYDKASAANTSFVPLFEELLYEVWQAIANLRNSSGVNQQDDDRIFRLAEQLQYILQSRRQSQQLGREELAAATVLGWLDLTFSANTPVVSDLRAQATSPSDRLKIIGQRVGLAPHSRSASFFTMASDLSAILRTLEAGYVSGPESAWLLYAAQVPTGGQPLVPPAVSLASESRRVITEWSAATGKDLKTRARPVQVSPTRPLVAAR
jgi:hypothetical protein